MAAARIVLVFCYDMLCYDKTKFWKWDRLVSFFVPIFSKKLVK